MRIAWRNELLMWLVITGMFVLSGLVWSSVPERMPVHWNLQGEVDGYGSRFVGLLALPLVTLTLYLLLLVLPLVDPGRLNYASFHAVYTIIRDALVCFMAVLHVVIVSVGLGYHVDVTTVVCLATAALFMLLGNLMGKVRPNWFVGFRTPWTLSSNASWNKTNRAGGWFLILLGLLVAAMGIVKTTWMLIVFLLFTFGSVIGLYIYSYIVYRNDPHRISPAGTSPEGK